MPNIKKQNSKYVDVNSISECNDITLEKWYKLPKLERMEYCEKCEFSCFYKQHLEREIRKEYKNVIEPI